MKSRSIVTALAVLGISLAGAGAAAQQTWKVTGGDVAIGLLSSLMTDLGIPIQRINSTAEPSVEMEGAFGMRITRRSDMVIVGDHGRIVSIAGGGIRADGGFVFGRAPRTMPFINPVVESNGSDLELGFRMSAGQVVLDLRHAKVNLNPFSRQLTIGFADVLLSQSAARTLGRPELAGQLIGCASVTAYLELIDGKVDPPVFFGDGGGGGEQDNPDPVDCQLFALSSLTSLGRTGTFPNGRNGLSMSTTSCNVGPRPIGWWAPMDTRHPVISMNLYRVMNDRFEHIGLSWLKHGFLSTNSNGCGTCQSPPFGSSQLGLNCSDTYGTGNNGDRQWLGERKEVNPFTGKWECRGSWFSNYVDDCVRRNGSSQVTDPVSHRLEVNDADMNVTGAEFYYEAYYIVDNDYDKYNNVGYRKATATWAGSQWSFSTTTNLVRAPALTVWDPNAQIANPRTEGDVWVGRRVLDLGGGMFRYLYAVYVHDLDRQVREFVVPILAGANVTNIRFRDVDADAGNDWPGVYANGMVKWSTQTYQQNQNANSLKYSTVFNFEFDADVAPDSTMRPIALGQFKPGNVPHMLRANVSSPLAGWISPTSMQVLYGTLQSGGLLDVLDVDGQRLSITEFARIAAGAPSTNVEFVGQGSIGNPSAAKVTLVARTTAVPAAGVTLKTSAFDYVGNAWVEVDSRPATSSDATIEINLSNPSRFIQGGTREMKLRVAMHEAAPLAFAGWQCQIEQVKWTLTR